MMVDPRPLSAAFEHDRESLGTIPFVRVLVEEDDTLDAECFDIDGAMNMIIQADEATLLDCIDEWVKRGNNRAQKKDELTRDKVVMMHESVKKIFTKLKSDIRGLIVEDDVKN